MRCTYLAVSKAGIVHERHEKHEKNMGNDGFSLPAGNVKPFKPTKAISEK
ncbi:MAG: hypothetical protein Q8Q50_09835 [Methylobacter sp.]|nr:hypothetical protein [Methylobacter sp.]